MIPHSVKGRGITGALRYVMGQGNDAETGERLTLGEGETSRAQILGGQNFGFEIKSADDLELARRMMEWNGLPQNQAGKTRKLDKDLLHASLSWEPGQKPDRAEMMEAGQSYLKALGLEKARAVFIVHDDTDHPHMHIIASRIDPETRRRIGADYDQIEGQKWAVKWEKAHGQERSAGAGKNLHALIDAVESRDVNALLSHLTRDKATFQISEVSRALAYGDFSADERAQFRADILGSKNLIGLRETAEAPISRYTTRDVLAAEMSVGRDALALADDKSHGVKAERIDKAIAKFTLIPEQAEALRHLAGAEGFSVLYGQAGTGKSHALKAVRAVYEAEGKEVLGLAFTNKVVKGMRADGFEANTITSEMLALEKGRTSWSAKTVVVVDEAAMLSTEQLARVTAAAKQAGAKLILAGDDKQLSSIDRGGIFETLRQNHGAATLKEVQRNKDPEQKAAFNKMHDYNFLDALKTFEKKGGIHWTTRQSDTLKQMAERYIADSATAPEKSRFMFAATNKEVDALNGHARALRKERGDLGEDCTVKTATGEREFATGDRIQFAANGRTKKEKRAGLVNGAVGTVAAIEIDQHDRARVTVELDAEKGAKPQRVSFVVGENAEAGEFNSIKHGYAGTIYRGQGDTLDIPYVGHSAQFRGRTAYVALSRHREEVHVFAARETVQTLEAMAEGMSRTDNKRAATAYEIDAPSAARAELAKAVEEYRAPPASESLAAMPAVAVPLRQGFGEQEAMAGGQETARIDAPAATIESAAPAVAEASAGTPAHAPEQATGEAASAADISSEVPAERALEALGAMAEGIAHLADGVADFAEGAIEGLADFFGGGSSAPAAKKPEPPAEPPPKKPATLDEYVAQRRQQHAAELEEIARSLGAGGETMSADELRMEKEAQEKRRDRGGGISR